MKFSREMLFWLVAYVALMACLTGAMFYARASALTTLDTPRAREEWKVWRHEAEKRDEITRNARGEQAAAKDSKPRRTRGDDPPALVFLRDLFWTCLGIMYLICTVMFGVFAFLLRGALTTGSAPSSDPPSHSSQLEA